MIDALPMKPASRDVGGLRPRLARTRALRYLRPTVSTARPERSLANTEFMPFVSVVECPQQEMLEKTGRRWSAAITEDKHWKAADRRAVYRQAGISEKGFPLLSSTG
jgi:hypothetical protein